MLNYGNIRKQTLALLDEYSSSGNVQTTADVLVKIRDMVNQAMVDLASTTAKIHGEYFLTHSPVLNELSRDTSSIKNHLPGIDFSVELAGAKAYFFEATGPGTVKVEESITGVWTELSSIDLTGSTMTEYKGLITASSAANTVRLRFTGDYIYRYRNYILYPYTFQTVTDIQPHKPHFEYDLPADFLKLDTVMTKRDTRQYVPYINFILRSDKKIAFNRYDVGEYLIHYWRMPTFFTFTGTESVDDAQTFGIDVANSIYRVEDEAALIIPYYAAGQVLMSESDLSKGIALLNMYEQKKVNLTGNNLGYTGSVLNIYGW